MINVAANYPQLLGHTGTENPRGFQGSQKCCLTRIKDANREAFLIVCDDVNYSKTPNLLINLVLSIYEPLNLMLQETVLVVKHKCFSSSSSFPVLNLPPPSCRLNHFQHLGLDLGLHLLLASVEVSFKENKQFMRFLKIQMFVLQSSSKHRYLVGWWSPLLCRHWGTNQVERANCFQDT